MVSWGLLGTAASGFVNVYLEHRQYAADRALADLKRESDIILKMADVPDEKQRAKNLLWFAHYKYISLKPEDEQQLRQLADVKSGDPLTPPSSFGPEAITKLIPQNVFGLALTQHDRDLDFAAVKQRGLRFVYVRITSGLRIDKSAGDRINKASAGDLRIGLFHVFDSRVDPAQQADAFISQLKQTQWDLPP